MTERVSDAAAPAAAGRPGTALARAEILVPLVLFALLAVLPWAATALGSEYLMTLAARIMIFAMAAISLDLILGYGALVSFGHAAFVGIGAYSVGILSSHGIGDALVTFPAAILAAALFALATGAVSLKTRGVYFIMITLAFGQMAYFTATSLSAYGGDDGLTLWSRSSVAGSAILEDERGFYYAVWMLLLGVYGLCHRIVRSRFGRVLRGAKENEQRMRAVGHNPYVFRLAAYVIAGAIAGLSGALLANQAEFVSPAYMSWQRSGELIIMVVLGGMGTLFGPLLGAAAFLLTEEVLSHVTQHWKVIFGPLLVLVVLFTRSGLAGLFGRGGRRG